MVETFKGFGECFLWCPKLELSGLELRYWLWSWNSLVSLFLSVVSSVEGERTRLVTGEVELSRAGTRVHRSSCRGVRHGRRPFIDDEPWNSQLG